MTVAIEDKIERFPSDEFFVIKDNFWEIFVGAKGDILFNKIYPQSDLYEEYPKLPLPMLDEAISESRKRRGWYQVSKPTKKKKSNSPEDQLGRGEKRHLSSVRGRITGAADDESTSSQGSPHISLERDHEGNKEKEI